MQGIARLILPLGCLVLGSFGCARDRDVRVVYRDGEGGVIGIPQNTNRWPHYYRERASREMAAHFPGEGYLVVREVEVGKGSRTTFDGSSHGAEVNPIVETLKLGMLRRSRNHGEQQSQQLTESHIFYVKNDPNSLRKTGSYSSMSTYTPAAYDGPIAARLLAHIDGGAPKDPETKLAGHVTAHPKATPTGVGEKPGGQPEATMPRPIVVPKLDLPD